MYDATVPLTSHPTVSKFVEDLASKELTPAETQSRLTTLEDFCRFVDRSPEEMIDEVFDVETRKYKKRNFYSSKVVEFAAQQPGSKQQQTARGNVIRNFFIANGRRLFNEKPDWL